MSWSINANGPKEEALADIRKQVANAYHKPGTPEGDDIVEAGKSIERLTNALAPSEKVALSAFGSHFTTQDGITGASFSVSVSTTS